MTRKVFQADAAELLRRAVSVSHYGAVGDGSTDDTAAIQAAITYAQTGTGHRVYFPPGTYLHTGLTVSKMLILEGAGANHTSLKLKSTVSNTTDNLTITPTVGGTQSRFLVVHDLTVEPQNAANGRHGIAFDLDANDKFLANIAIERCSIIGSTSGRAVQSIPDATPTVPALFDWTIRQCLLQGGVKLTGVADSLWWQNNLSAGANAGLEIDTVAGAAGSVIRDSTFVNAGGGIWAKSLSTSLHVLDNYFESAVAWSGGSGNNALLDFDGTSAGDIVGPVISGNQFSLLTGFVGQCVRLKNVTGAKLSNNELAPVDVGTFGVLTASSTAGTILEATNRLQSGAGTLLSNPVDTSILNKARDRGGEASLALNATVSLGATIAGTIHLYTTATGDGAVGYLHDGANFVSSILATNFGGAGTGFTLGADTGTGFSVYHDGSVYRIKNRNAATRTVRWQITGLS